MASKQSDGGAATGRGGVRASEYSGPVDLGRAESLYRSALGKPDLDYSSQLLFASLRPITAEGGCAT